VLTRVVPAVLVLLALAAYGQERAPWLLSTDERLALRFDSRAAAERMRVYAQSSDDELSAMLPPFLIDGRRNPELLLPSELMAFLLAAIHDAGSARAGSARTRYSLTVEALQWDVDRFWADLDEASSRFAALLRESTVSKRSDETSIRLCESRIAALSEMRKRYDRFDEFLYRAIAPETVLTSDRAPARTWLLWLERGCK
jgi:hypothetical protein